MKKRIFSLLILFLGVFASSALFADSPPSSSLKQTAEQIAFFEKQVRPVLIKKCYRCHSEKKQWAELRLDSRQLMLKGGESGPAIVPGNPKESLLMLAIRHSDEASEMPPEEEQLAEKEITSISRWIQMGAPWPATDTVEEVDYFTQAKTHWAFQPVRKPNVPKLPDGYRGRNAIDHFIARKLKQAGLKQSPPADAQTLLRRLSFDLTGLPVEYKQFEKFNHQPTDVAYRMQLDHLLASKTYGQHWARYWLDLARYADTKGYIFQEERQYPFAYTYRDYVIESFNEDLPYDQFIREQLAADLLPEKRNEKAIAALGFLTVGPRFLNRKPDIYDDRIDVTIRGLQALTIACARCHDHKYDPINMADYYALYGVFDSSVEPAELPQIGKPANEKDYAQYEKEYKKFEAAALEYKVTITKEINQELREHVEDYLLAAVKKAGHRTGSYSLEGLYQTRNRVRDQWIRFLKSRKVDDPVFGPFVQLAKLKDDQFAAKSKTILASLLELKESEKTKKEGKPATNPLVISQLQKNKPAHLFDLVKIYAKLSREAFSELKAKPEDEQAAWEQIHRSFEAPGMLSDYTQENIHKIFNAKEQAKYRNLKKKAASLMVNSPGSPPRAMVLTDKKRPASPVIFKRGNPGSRGKKVPRQFLKVLSDEKNKPFSNNASGRYELAVAIANSKNPLTARVLVNRVWMQLIGNPLVENTSDFGLRTSQPTHPELLDYLSAEFVSHDWSVKWLVREITLSETYRQSSLANDFGFEVDLLNRFVWRMNRKRMTFETMRDSMLFSANVLNIDLNGRPEKLEGKSPTHRRAIYGFIDRNNVSQLLRTFDVAGPSSSVSKRPRTTVPQQALYAMNSPFVMSIAATIVESIETTKTTPAIVQLYQKVLGRNPQQEEQNWCEQFIETQPENKNAWQELAQTLLLSNEFMFID